VQGVDLSISLQYTFAMYRSIEFCQDAGLIIPDYLSLSMVEAHERDGEEPVGFASSTDVLPHREFDVTVAWGHHLQALKHDDRQFAVHYMLLKGLGCPRFAQSISYQLGKGRIYHFRLQRQSLCSKQVLKTAAAPSHHFILLQIFQRYLEKTKSHDNQSTCGQSP
jgi:hypothetical protein